jgi:hypothetical protein
MTDNMQYWNSFNQPPRTALKEIQAGRMKGKTDINPQWRYEAMTKTFGVVGIGWKFTIDKMWTEIAANDETMAFVNVSVYVKVDGSWSDAIQGNGGSTLVVHESSKMYNDDDAFKKATTDALSTAMKMLGVAADIYAGGWDGAKYRNEQSKPATETERKAHAVKAFAELKHRAAKVNVTLTAMDAGWDIDKMSAHYKEQLAFVKSAEEQAGK